MTNCEHKEGITEGLSVTYQHSNRSLSKEMAITFGKNA